MEKASVQVFARRSLEPQFDGARDAILLEGHWSRPSVNRWSLDEAIDSRFRWIDVEAARLARQAAGSKEGSGDFPRDEWFYLSALKLRYWFVKLLRVIAFFDDVIPLKPGDSMRLVLAAGRDEPYAALFTALCRARRASLTIQWSGFEDRAGPHVPRNGGMRRMFSSVNDWLGRHAPASDAARRKFVLCGNPNHLEPVCRELIRRGHRAWWLYDRFAFRAALRWHFRGVGQLVCNSEAGDRDKPPLPQPLPPLVCRGVELTPALGAWRSNVLDRFAGRHARLLKAVERHFQHIRPAAVILDQDATPLARAAVLAARRLGAKSVVVQHGAPCVRFGFAPLAADRIFVWGESSRRQLVDWEVPRRRIIVSGAVKSGTFARQTRPPRYTRQRRILVLDTVAPSDERPDAVDFHLTRRTYGGMIDAVCAAVSRLPHARLTVKLHPRAHGGEPWQRARRRFPELSVRIVRRGSLMRHVSRADCVLSFASSAGIEAAAAGWPVIQFLPIGCGDLLAAQQWGLLGTARCEQELTSRLSDALEAPHVPRQASDSRVFFGDPGSAADRIVVSLLGLCAERRAEHNGTSQDRALRATEEISTTRTSAVVAGCADHEAWLGS